MHEKSMDVSRGSAPMKLLLTLSVCLLLASPALGVVIKAYNGNIPFDHKKHRSMFKCADCHEGSPRYIELDKQTAHALCIGCHKKEKRGPSVHCSECHQQELEEN